MIIRDAINARYTHDMEAMIAWLLGLREFAGVSAAEIEGWLGTVEPFSFCADYQAIRGDDLNPDYIHFWPVGTFVCCTAEDRARIFRVALWKPQDTARALIEKHGFSCIICGARTPWGERAGLVWNELLRTAMRERQEVSAPVLACQPCVADLNCFLAYAERGVSMDKVVHGFVRRLQPGGFVEDVPVRKKGRQRARQ